MSTRTLIAGAICLIGILSFGQATKNPNFELLSPQGQLIPAHLKDEFLVKHIIWPEKAVKNKISKKKVPPKVLSDTEMWIKRILKSEYIPPNVKEWLIPIRKTVSPTAPRKEDYLVVRYKKGNVRVQIQDNYYTLTTLFVFDTTPTLALNIKDYIIQVAKKTLNLPLDKIKKISFEFLNKKKTSRGEKIFYGIIKCESRIEKSGRRNWWESFSVKTNKQFVFFAFTKLAEDVPPPAPVAKPLSAYPKRFLE